MDNRRIFAHPDYFSSLHLLKAEKNIADLTPIVTELFRILTTEPNPLALGKRVDKRPGRWEIEVQGVVFIIEPEGDDIKVVRAK